MRLILAAAAAVAVAALTLPARAQVGNPATPRTGSPQSGPSVGPAAAAQTVVPRPRTGPLPTDLSLTEALEEAFARSPALAAAEAELRAAEGRLRQAGYRDNPELSLEVENVFGTGELRGIQSMETTLAVNQRLDLGGRRSARVSVARAQLMVQRVRFAIARADLARSVREQFARALAASERLEQARENVARAQELARVTSILVDAGRDAPLRRLRARSAVAQAQADLEQAVANELAARSSLAALFGVSAPVDAVSGEFLDLIPQQIAAERSLEVLLAEAERAAAAAGVEEQLAERRLDPAVGVGVRHVRETGDVGFVAGVSMPLRLFDRNRGNIEAARASLLAAQSRRGAALASVTAQARNAIAAVEAAERRVSALDRSAIPEAREALRLTDFAYREGRASLLEVIDAQSAYTAARTSLTEARLGLALATAELGRIAAQQDPTR